MHAYAFVIRQLVYEMAAQEGDRYRAQHVELCSGLSLDPGLLIFIIHAAAGSPLSRGYDGTKRAARHLCWSAARADSMRPDTPEVAGPSPVARAFQIEHPHHFVAPCCCRAGAVS